MILVSVEQNDGKLSRSTLEMFTAARTCGREGEVTALVLGEHVEAAAAEAARYADQVLVGDLPELAVFNAEMWAAAVSQIAEQGEAVLVLISGSRGGREFSPRVAVALEAPLIEDAISLRSSGNVVQAQRYSFLSRVTETVETDASVVVVTTKPGSFEPAQPREGGPAEEFDVDLQLPARRLRVTGAEKEKSTRVPLSEADIVVAGGRGVGSPEDFERLVAGLADEMGAAVAATRAVVDAGWRPYGEQVGQTGKTVQPKLYVAIGISGAVQHLSGMNKSKYIVAINKDADAPIFTIADYAIVADVKQVVPALIEALRAS